MSDQDDYKEEPSSGGFFNHLPTILWQRRWFAIPPIVLMSTAGVIASLVLPTTYRSAATLLVQSQQLPTNIADAPTNALIDQRIAKIRQQVLSRGDLVSVIEQNDLYGQERRSRPLSEIVDRMREDVAVQAVTGDIGQASSGNQSNTIAFRISYDYRDPVKAQAVMQNFVQRFLEVDTSNTEDRANETVSFLQDQATKLQQQIATLERQITGIKTQNGMALASSGAPVLADGGGYDAQIIQLQNQNRILALQTGRVVKNPVIVAAQAQLDAARATYAEGHPDVVLAKQRLEEAKRNPESAGADDRSLDAKAIREQIAANNAAMAALNQARAQDRARAASSLSNQARSPLILEQISQLENRANILRQQYEQASDNLLKAQGTARMAQEQKGERLSVVDPPVVPDKPISPNRPLLIAGGIGTGVALGLVLALLVEMLLRPVRGVEAIEGLGLEPLGVVPTFKIDRGANRRKRRADASAAAAPEMAPG